MIQCQGKRTDGSRCRHQARPARKLCIFHDPETARKCAEGRRRGGLNRSRPATRLPVDTPDAPLASVQDVAAFLAVTMNQVRTGRVGVNIGNCLFVGAGVLLKALQTETQEQRIAALEAALGRRGANGRHW
jgi:hypothetical protein